MRYKSKLIVLFCLFTGIFLIWNVSKGYAANEYPDRPTVDKPGPQLKQTVTMTVEAENEARPGVYWFQLDSGRWRAEHSGGTFTDTSNIDPSHKMNEPTAKWVEDRIDLRNYAPGIYSGPGVQQVPRRLVTNEEIQPNKSKYIRSGTSYYSNSDLLDVVDKTFINLKVLTGKKEANPNSDYKVSDHWDSGKNRPNGAPKYAALYRVYLSLHWRGLATESKEIRVLQNSTLQIGQSKSYKAEIRTKEFTSASFGRWTDVSTRRETVWKSDNSAVAVVNASGRVEAKGKGQTTIRATWKEGLYHLSASAKVTVGGPQEGECTVPAEAGEMSARHMDPKASAVIKADQRNAERFDVLKGIPTTEDLYANAVGLDYLFKNRFVKYTGKCTFEIEVLQPYQLTWKIKGSPGGARVPPTPDIPQSAPDENRRMYTIERPYEFWAIDNLEVYQLDQAVLTNYALPNEEVVLLSKGYTPPSYSVEISEEHIVPPKPRALIELPTISMDGGYSRPSPQKGDLRQHAEQEVKKIQVRNDSLQFAGATIMDNRLVEERGPVPRSIPEPRKIGQDVLYENGLSVPAELANKSNQPSNGTIIYELMPDVVNGGEDAIFEIHGINSVTVHTPVVNYSKLPDDNRPFDQRMQPDMSRTVLILDRPFTIHFNETGQHRDIPGYGHRDYGKYTKQKRVKFPFGVFQGSQYYHANTWITIPVGTPSMTFRMPTWVTEGNYQIRTESWAINEQGMDSDRACEPNKNGNLANYCAYETFEVGVVGRLFGFRVWDIGDLRFEKVFRTQKGSKTHTGASYYSGGRDENGQPTNRLGKNSWILPIRQGSHPNERATVAHNGYPFLFDFKTIGNVWDKGEGIRIDPTFWYVPRKGGTPTQVDLYYDASGAANKMIRVGSSKDKQTYTRMYRLADPFRNMNQQELQKAASYEYNYILSSYERSNKPWSKFYNEFVKRSIQISNGYDIEILPYKSRTLIGPTSIPHGVDATEALRSVQHWYGEYHLPIAPYILPKGTNVVALADKYGGALDGHEKEFLKNGYLIVNFGIYTVKNNDIDTRVLGYKAPIANMWAIEGQIQSDSNYLGRRFNFQAGDIMMFESDFSVRNDFQGQGR